MFQIFRLKDRIGITSIAGIFLSLWLAPALASELFDVPVTQGNEVPIEKFAVAGDNLIIWTPSDFGIQPPQSVLGKKLRILGLRSGLPISMPLTLSPPVPVAALNSAPLTSFG